MPSTDLSLIIDPGGSPGRPGINLQVFPSGSEPISQAYPGESGRTASSALIAGGYSDITEFTIESTLEASDFHLLNGLISWSQQAKSQLTPFEVVIYNLIQPYSELGATRSRFLVPGSTILSQVELDTGYFSFTYWVALQGLLYLRSATQVGNCYQVVLSFQEGTKLTQAMELL